MKHILFTFVILPGFLFAAFDFSHPESIENLEILLTKERSGTNWTIAILQILTRKPVALFDESKNVTNRLKLELDNTKSPLYRTHDVLPGMRKIDPSKNKLLMTLRNYKECVFRKNKNPMQFYNDVISERGSFKHYIDNLRFFDSWSNEETKHLIYYEDLITEPRENITHLLNFFDENTDNLDDFFNHYDYWRDLVMASYDKQHKVTTKRMVSSNGDKTIFHSVEIPLFLQKKIDKHIKEHYPELWKKYLSRYETL